MDPGPQAELPTSAWARRAGENGWGISTEEQMRSANPRPRGQGSLTEVDTNWPQPLF